VFPEKGSVSTRELEGISELALRDAIYAC